ncbi:MAG: UrcA family protein [Pseudomonadota bacterium]
MLKIIALAPLAFGLAATSVTAAQSEEPTVSVRYADLNLTTEEGRRVLDRRLVNAAEKACGGRPDPRNLNRAAAFRECFKSAKTSYEAQRLAVVKAANEKRVAMLADKLGFVFQR